MSDREDPKTPESTASHTPAETLEMNSTPVIRYTKQVLLSLHDSPLVAKPTDMPPLSSWFGDDPDAPISKSILNGSTLTRSSDKNVLLAPNKSVFSSASYGKLQEDSASNRTSHSSLTSRHRHATDETRTRDYGLSSKDARPPRSSEKSFMIRGSDKNERRVTPSQNNIISSNNKRQQQQQQQQQQPISTNNATRYRRDTRTPRSSNADNSTTRSSDRLPEWMDYNPTSDSSSHSIEKTKQTRQNTRPEFENDLEAWKRDMKQKELGSGIDSVPEKDSISADNRKTGAELDMVLGVGSLDLHGSNPQLQQQQQQQTQRQEIDFLSVSVLEGMGSPSTVGGRRERGSRFAKFFAKRDEEGLTPPAQTEQQPRSITVNDLFRGVGEYTPTAEVTVDMSFQQPPIPVAPEATTNLPDVRMLSEEEVMRTLGAKKSPVSMQPTQATSDNALGFDKVLQILSQPKPTAANQQPLTFSNQNEKDYESTRPEKNSVDAEDVSSSHIAPDEKHTIAEGGGHQQHQAQKPKLANNRFAGNLPTSVLRQMSARSSESRSPSLSSNKSVRTFATGGSASPALSIGSPAAMKAGLPVTSHDNNLPNGHPYPTAPIYHRIPPSSPGYTLTGTRNPIADPSMVPGRQPRNNGPPFDHMLQYGDGLSPAVLGRAGPMNPMIPPPLSYGQGQQQQQQQQQGMDQFMAPHVMQPMPPHIPPVGPGGHIIPPHHLPLHLQGQVPPQFTSMQREMMVPPGVPPPHMMGGAGLPPHLFPKGPGWDRR